MKRIAVTPKQVAAARVRVAGDRVLKLRTPAWIVRVADLPLPEDRSADDSRRTTPPKVAGSSPRRKKAGVSAALDKR